MPEEHKIFMREYEKYGNNYTLIAKVLNTWTPAQIKKHAESFFRQNLKRNSAAVKQYQESLSPDKKAQILITHVAEQQNYSQVTTCIESSRFFEKQSCMYKKKISYEQEENLDSTKKIVQN